MSKIIEKNMKAENQKIKFHLYEKIAMIDANI